MTPTDTYLVLAVLVAAAGFFGLGARSLFMAMKYRRIGKHERIRGRFADARNRLVWLALKEQISPKSVTFRETYLIHTFMMAHADDYGEISRQMWFDRDRLAAENARLRELYSDLIYQVATKHPGESRHQTAKRYIHERENPAVDQARAALADSPAREEGQ